MVGTNFSDLSDEVEPHVWINHRLNLFHGLLAGIQELRTRWACWKAGGISAKWTYGPKNQEPKKQGASNTTDGWRTLLLRMGIRVCVA